MDDTDHDVTTRADATTRNAGESAPAAADSTGKGKPAPGRSEDEPSSALQPVSPITHERSIGSFDFRRRLSLVKARTTTVVITARGQYVVYPPSSPPSVGELVRRRARFLSQVDMGLYQSRIVGDLPCQGDAFGFPATIDLHWRVKNAETVVRDGVRDVRKVLESYVLGRLRPVTRVYTVEQTEAAESDANRTLRQMPELDMFGLEAMAFVRLGMDDAARDRVRMTTRVEAYRTIIAAGDLHQFALRLAENPKDVADVISMLVQERDTHRQDTVNFVTQLIDSGAIERWEIDDQIRTVLQWLRDTTNRVITGTDEARRASLGADQISGSPTRNGASRSTEPA
jgi:hypothetical protein